MAQQFAMGWHRDLPDVRDFDPSSVKLEPMFDDRHPMFDKQHKGSGEEEALQPSVARLDSAGGLSDLPPKRNLRRWFSDIEDQGPLGSCTAQAGVGLLEYFERRAAGRHTNASRLFLYKSTRKLMEETGDTGAYLRTTMKAMALFGVPPERYWPYDISKYDDEPEPFLYAYGQNVQSLVYGRLDPPGHNTGNLLARIRLFLAAGYPSMFGFTVYNHGNEKGEIPFPQSGDRVLGGHAVVAAGYDDNYKINGEKGALKIRNSWGRDWGEDGYGWLPYKYVEAGLAVDFWTLFKNEYVDPARFDSVAHNKEKTAKKK